ncbi:MAG: hypothetical protein GX621_02920, partial [Pirellulaceae bacterium]|nr:hypothetical protein [Pirellulaceae bacterium]
MIKKLLALTLVVALAGTAHAATWTWTGGAETSDWYGAGNWSTDDAIYTNPTQAYVGTAGTGPVTTQDNFLYLNPDVTAITISGATVDKTVNVSPTTSNSLIMGGISPVMNLSSGATLNLGTGTA